MLEFMPNKVSPRAGEAGGGKSQFSRIFPSPHSASGPPKGVGKRDVLWVLVVRGGREKSVIASPLPPMHTHLLFAHHPGFPPPPPSEEGGRGQQRLCAAFITSLIALRSSAAPPIDRRTFPRREKKREKGKKFLVISSRALPSAPATERGSPWPVIFHTYSKAPPPGLPLLPLDILTLGGGRNFRAFFLLIYATS